MSERNYWFVRFSGHGWKRFEETGSTEYRFCVRNMEQALQIQVDDYLLCYLTGLSRFIGVLRVVTAVSEECFTQCGDGATHCAVEIKPLIVMAPETALPVSELKSQLDCFNEGMDRSHGWMKQFRQSPMLWEQNEGQAVVAALLKIRQHPKKRRIDKASMARRPAVIESPLGPVTFSEMDADPGNPENRMSDDAAQPGPANHAVFQALMLKLGKNIDFEVWLSQRERQRIFQGKTFEEIFEFQKDLPQLYHRSAMAALDLFDLIWLDDTRIAAVFQVAGSGDFVAKLLPVLDFAKLAPDIDLPIYFLVPDRLRNRLIAEINRPAFAGQDPPLAEQVRMIGFKVLQRELKTIIGFPGQQAMAYIANISESCDPEEL
jgi:hypothetical protein